MRTLEQIRDKNKKDDLLLIGMEEKPVSIPYQLQQNEKEVYKGFIKPIARRTMTRYIEKTR